MIPKPARRLLLGSALTAVPMVAAALTAPVVADAAAEIAQQPALIVMLGECSSAPLTPFNGLLPVLRVSRYVAVSRQRYQHESGRTVRVCYHAGNAQAFLLDTDTAATLSADIGRLLPADRERLRALGVLVPADHDEAAAVIAAGQRQAAEHRVRRFVIMPSAYCNMTCRYCGQEHRRGSVTGDHRDVLAARVDRAMSGGRYDEVHVRWFGGEPLLGFAVVRDLSRRFVAAADRHAVGYAARLVTNGALLDLRKLRSLVEECRVHHVEVTIDGTETTHDRSRVLRSGHGSFQRIMTTLRTALDDPRLAALRFSVRTNVGVHNADEAEPFAGAMRAAGLADRRVVFYPAGIHPWGNDVSELAVAPGDTAATELRWLRAYVDHGLTTPLLPTATRPVVCVAVDRHSEVAAPDGRLYSCTEQPLVPGLADRAVGTIDGLAPDEPRPAGEFDDWYAALAANETGCRDCRILPVCGGHCPKLWREGTAPCPPLKSTVADRLDLYARQLGLVPVTTSPGS